MKNKVFFPTMIVFLIFLTACQLLVIDATDQTPEPQKNDEEIEPAEIVNLDKDRTSMRVLYTVSNYILDENFDGDEADAKAIINEPLDITDTQILFLDQMCVDVVFKEASVNLPEYLTNNWQVTSRTLGIEDIEEGLLIQTNCHLFGFKEYLRLSDGRLIVTHKDVFYFFKPNVVY